jgi:type II secretory pathway component PulF
LAIVLNRLAGYFERTAAFKRKIISALIYPMILLFASLGALLFMTIKIIPAFAEIFKGMDMEIPLLTKILIAFSVFLREKIFLVMGAAGVVIYLLKRYINTKAGRKRYENFKFRLPLLGEFFHAIAVERFSSEMSTLLESGVPILYSFEIAEHSVGNSVTAEVIRGIKDEVRDGKPLMDPFEKCGFFEPMVVQMVGIGEEIGELPQMFKKINAFYQEYTETFLGRIVSMFEPAILIFMGGVIGIIVVGIFMPIFQMTQIKG